MRQFIMVEPVTDTIEDEGRFLLELYRNGLTLPEKELYDYFLDHAVQITRSKIGFFHGVTDDQKTIILTTWNKEALKTCASNYENHYPIEKAGNWADCVRLKHPVIYNNFSSSPNQRGLPEGHVRIKRILSVPIIEDGNVQVIFGVGNKIDPYSKEDVVQLDLVANELNKIMKQRKAEKELRESKEKYRSLFANMTEGFFLGRILVDNEGKPADFVFLEVNNGFEKQSGLRAVEVVGKTAKQALPGIEQSWIETYGKVSFTGKPDRFENYNQSTNRWYEVYAYSPAKGQFAAMFTDITERKKMLSQLENNSYNLERLVQERTQELREKERMAAIGQTAAMVGHDLRNPLQAVTGEIYLVKKELDLLPKSQEKNNLMESIELIELQASYMDKIVTDLQSFVKPIEVSMKGVNVKQLLSATMLQIQIPANVNTRINVDDALKVNADPQLLKRVLINLLSNAVQAMPEGGKLLVSAQADPQGKVSITVSDTGTGIPEAIKTKIFTPLFTTKAKGQGLGLASCKRIVEAQGGSISFISEMGKGTEFTINLP